jgi:hypothetical protein
MELILYLPTDFLLLPRTGNRKTDIFDPIKRFCFLSLILFDKQGVCEIIFYIVLQILFKSRQFLSEPFSIMP